MQKLKNQKILFYFKMNPHMKIFLPANVFSHLTDTLCNIVSQGYKKNILLLLYQYAFIDVFFSGKALLKSEKLTLDEQTHQ